MNHLAQIDPIEKTTQNPAFFEAVFNQASNAMLVVDDARRIVNANAAAEQLLGYSTGELIDLACYNVFHSIEPDVEVTESWSSFMLQGRQSGTVELLRKDGSLVICHYNSTANFLPGYHLSVLTDVTQREKKHRESLEKSRQVEKVLDKISDSFFAVDTNWTVTYWNKATEQLLKKPRHEVLGKNLWEVYADAYDRFFHHYDKAMHEHKVVNFEEYYPPLNIWTEVVAYPSISGLAIYFRDITAKKQADCQLLQTEKNYSTLINASADRIWSVDADLKIISANETFKTDYLRHTGHSREEGDDILDPFFGEAQVNRWKSFYQKALGGERVKFEEKTQLRGAIGASYFEMTFDPIHDVQSGEVIGVACHSRDITEAKGAEILIKQQNKKLQESGRYVESILSEMKQIMNSSLDVICATDYNGVFLQVSAASIAVWGYSPAEVIGRNYMHFVHPDDIEKTKSIRMEMLAGKKITNFENRFIRKDGTTVPLIWSSSLDEKQNTVVSVAKDATSIKEAERLKAENEIKFTSLVENSNDIITIMDADFNYKYESPSAKRVMGFDASERIGKHASEFMHPEDAPFAVNAVKSLQLDGETISITYRLKVSTGEWHWFEASISKHLDNPAIKGYVLNKRDITQRKQTEWLLEEKNQALKERETSLSDLSRKLQKIMDSSADIICCFDKEGHFLQVNKASEKILGYTAEELIGRKYITFLADGERERTEIAAAARINGTPQHNFENIYLHKNGDHVPILWSASWDALEQVMYCVGKNVTALKNAEKKKIDTERKFSALIEKGSDIMNILDGQGNYLFISPNIERVFGYTIEDLVGASVFDLVHPDDVVVAKTAFADILQTEEEKNLIVRFKDKQGRWRLVEVVGRNLTNDPAVKGIVMNSRDVTDRKEKEEEVRTANERFEMVLNATNEVIYDWNLETNELFWNKNFGRVFGYDGVRSEKNLEFWRAHVHPEDMDRVINSFNDTLQLASPHKWQTEYRFVKANGEMANVLEQGHAIFNEDNKPVRFVGAIRDITENKKKESERESIITELTRINNDLKQFSFITSHNLRAPLSNILGILRIIDSSCLNEENKTLVEMIETSASQLNQTLDDLGKILVIRNNNKLEQTELQVSVVLNSVNKTFVQALNEIAAKMIIDLEVDNICFNATYLESIFINLISNSIKYRSPQRSLEIKVTTHRNECNDVVLTFSDNGSGFDYEKYQDRVGGLYQRFHSDVEGNGLGLFIVKSQIIALGGRLEIESRENEGTTFTITIRQSSHLS